MCVGKIKTLSLSFLQMIRFRCHWASVIIDYGSRHSNFKRQFSSVNIKKTCQITINVHVTLFFDEFLFCLQINRFRCHWASVIIDHGSRHWNGLHVWFADTFPSVRAATPRVGGDTRPPGPTPYAVHGRQSAVGTVIPSCHDAILKAWKDHQELD